jgi:hypothetical protein
MNVQNISGVDAVTQTFSVSTTQVNENQQAEKSRTVPANTGPEEENKGRIINTYA